MSIRNKLILFLILPLALFIFVFIFISNGFVQTLLLENYKSSYNELLNTHTRYFDQVLRNGVNLADNTASFIKDNLNLDEKKLGRMMKDIIRSEKVIYGVDIAFEPGVFNGKERFAPFYFEMKDTVGYIDLAESRSGYDYRDGSHEWYNIPAKTKKPHWSEPFYSGVLKGTKIITYSTPILDGDKFLGVVVVDYALEELDEYLRSSFDTGTQRFVILSKEGKYISHPDKNKIVDLSLLDDSTSIVDSGDKKNLLKSILSGDNGYIRVKRKDSGENILAFYSSIPISGWNIVAYELEDSLTAPIDDIFKKAFYALLIFFTAAFISVFFITSKFLSPIKQIRTFTRSITSGDYPEKLESGTKDEFAKLVTDLNIMNEMLQKRENDLIELNKGLEERVEQRTHELKETAELLKESNTEITLKNKYISDSINYAKQIQDAILPSNHFFRSLFPDYFLIFLPKDVVSGDFYWVTETDECKIFAVIDCTGHGVPGAFMSMIGNTLLNEIVSMGNNTDPGEILNILDKRVIEELNKEVNSDSFDGMDMALGVYFINSGKLSVAGAYRPVYYITDGVINEIKGTKKSIGDPRKTIKFSTTEIQLTAETEIYLFSDGITDQNNPENQKYGSRRLKEILLNNHSKSQVEQHDLLLQDLLAHKGEEVQRDDIAFLGLKLKPVLKKTLLNFEGVFSYDTIISLGDDLNQKMENVVPQKLHKKVFFVTNELMQNISYYSNKKEIVNSFEYGCGLIKICHNGEYLEITTINPTDEETFNRLYEKVSELNKMDPEELNQLKKIKLKTQAESTSKGGGIGLIEIIRRTGSPLLVSKKNDDLETALVCELKLFLGV